MKEELLISGVDDVLAVLKSDYDKAYFVTGEVFFLCSFWIVFGS